MRYLLFTLSALLFLSSCQKEAPKSPPNILLIMTDDQGYGDLSWHGNDSISTPNLDQLARESVQFDRFYVSQVCAPTRASLLTGRYHPRTGVTGVTSRREVMRAEETTLAEVLKAANYRTGIFGKWHNGEQYPNDPIGQGFDEFLGFCAGHWNNYFGTQLTHNQGVIETEGYIIDVLTDQAINFIESNKNQPFFCYVPYNTPHSPMQVADRYFDKYKSKGLSDFNAAAYGMCENIDDNVGRILEVLEAQNLAENTIVIFTTDNGPNGNRFNGNMKGWKGHYDEGGVRVPFFLRYPNGDFSVGDKVPQLAAHIDILPTLLELCELPIPDSLALDGKSLVPLLQGETNDWEDRNIYSFRHGAPFTPNPGAVRTPQYRWVLGRDSSVALYDMQKDPEQRNDIALQNPEIVADLGRAYKEMFTSVTTNNTLPPKIPVGYDAAKKVRLPAIEATQVEGDLRYKEGHAWANDWLINWTNKDDRIIWEVEVVESGNYQVEVEYVVAEENVGSVVAISGGETRLTTTVSEAFNPKPLPSPDRIPRKEVYEKEWAKLPIGELWLEKGVQRIELTAMKVANEEVMELKSLYLTRAF
ncbi:MAG: arylsulfatase [Bacteroidota bacterium]